MKKTLQLGSLDITWLNGGRFELDGGAMFGVVPKLLWKKKYQPDEDNFVPLTASPILIRTKDTNILIETGIGNKLTDKQRKVFRVREEWDILRDLDDLGMGAEDIHHVILTHFDFDHAGGVIMQDQEGGLRLTFPAANHIVQKAEWEDVLNPNKRSINTFWPINNELLRKSDSLRIIDGDTEIAEGVQVMLTGGHNRGHQVVRIESEGEVAVHLGDLLPTHVHFNPLWIMAYDNYPLDTIRQKEELEKKYIDQKAWFLFYHDPQLTACRFDNEGNIVEQIGWGRMIGEGSWNEFNFEEYDNIPRRGFPLSGASCPEEN